MTPFWKKSSPTPSRHADPDAAIAAYLEELHQAEVAGAATPAAALNGLGDAYLDRGDAISAIDYFRQAAEVYEREGMHDNAIACCRKIRRYAPDDPEVGLMLGRYYAAKGLRADAVTELGSYAAKQEGLGRRREAIEALREVTRLTPERPAPRERLGRLLAEEGQREEALSLLREALDTYRTGGDEDGAQRAESEIARLERAAVPPPPEVVTPPEVVAPPEVAGPDVAAFPEVDALEVAPPEVAAPLVIDERPEPAAARPVAAPPSELDIERTSYETELTPAELERASAEQHADAGRWSDAVISYRHLAELGRIASEDFATWAECARQMGEASKVLEALATSARWHLDRHDEAVARRAASEMLLIDPNNVLATDILEQMGTSLPRG
jgi:tetratricopeptide (TPR) repeat protein